MDHDAGGVPPLLPEALHVAAGLTRNAAVATGGRGATSGLGPGGMTTTGPDATSPPSYLSKLAGGGGGRREGRGGGIGSSAEGGAARNLLLPHAYLKGVGVSGGMGV